MLRLKAIPESPLTATSVRVNFKTKSDNVSRKIWYDTTTFENGYECKLEKIDDIKIRVSLYNTEKSVIDVKEFNFEKFVVFCELTLKDSTLLSKKKKVSMKESKKESKKKKVSPESIEVINDCTFYTWETHISSLPCEKSIRDDMLDRATLIQACSNENVESSIQLLKAIENSFTQGDPQRCFPDNSEPDANKLYFNMFGLKMGKGILVAFDKKNKVAEFSGQPAYLKAILQGGLNTSKAKVIKDNHEYLKQHGHLTHNPDESIMVGLPEFLKTAKSAKDLESRIDLIKQNNGFIPSIENVEPDDKFPASDLNDMLLSSLKKIKSISEKAKSLYIDTSDRNKVYKAMGILTGCNDKIDNMIKHLESLKTQITTTKQEIKDTKPTQ